MSSDDRFDDLEAELRALAGSLDVPEPPPAERVAASVRARLEAPAPRRRRVRWRVVAVAVVAILRYAGIELRLGGEAPEPVRTTASVPGEREVPAGQVAGQVAFPVRTLGALGEPERVTVGDGGRLVSMFWPDGLRFDQFSGRIEPFFFKRLGPPFPDEVDLGEVHGYWLSGEHPLGYILREGGGEVPLRQAGPTLIWQVGDVGYRLEGAPSMERAAELARSLR
jgi:hypothetical protein